MQQFVQDILKLCGFVHCMHLVLAIHRLSWEIFLLGATICEMEMSCEGICPTTNPCLLHISCRHHNNISQLCYFPHPVTLVPYSLCYMLKGKFDKNYINKNCSPSATLRYVWNKKSILRRWNKRNVGAHNTNRVECYWQNNHAHLLICQLLFHYQTVVNRMTGKQKRKVLSSLHFCALVQVGALLCCYSVRQWRPVPNIAFMKETQSFFLKQMLSVQIICEGIISRNLP